MFSYENLLHYWLYVKRFKASSMFRSLKHSILFADKPIGSFLRPSNQNL